MSKITTEATTLTPEQRIEAYEYAIKRLGNRQPYMCWSLKDYCAGQFRRYVDVCEMYSHLTEFALFCGKKNLILRWFEPTEKGNKTREIILLFCIEMAKDEIKLLNNE